MASKSFAIHMMDAILDRRRDRTCNLLIRSQAPCHWASRPVIVEEAQWKEYLYHGVEENSVLRKVAPAELSRSCPDLAQGRPRFSRTLSSIVRKLQHHFPFFCSSILAISSCLLLRSSGSMIFLPTPSGKLRTMSPVIQCLSPAQQAFRRSRPSQACLWRKKKQEL